MEINEKNVIMYLRKSRADDSAQQVCEVLAKHELQLQDYAVREFGKKISEEQYAVKLFQVKLLMTDR